ncbi:methylmalonyl Co-A mutase-associated GTPase MeaB [Gelidibacter maritimus]|uniref:Methylmalonyl Co-A mutase-associated GTPase MeaB n=1 Tax=Gelidibacter maritimus TaxID=2761487 RepID=A0A7W2R467_9FLAO|nr:methylmalonyl Co-A mutase-associated GTPase MeaB [Gelidibacter maritimus]MBA6152740.1 methylmalonyl Co-A mutase-associated GTPase MeaB [Gelidibacter maritimus]
MTKKGKTSALHENEGVSEPEATNKSAIAAIKNRRQKQPSVAELVKGILAQDRTALSRSITLVESTNPQHLKKANAIIQQCLPYANTSIRIGITGVPGVGKSTFIETFGTYLTSKGKQIAVLAVDPSSTVSRGSILGDKTRMEDLVKTDNAFIRPSPSGTSLGGVARKSREIIILCEAAGFDTILIETVGVGQSETAVHSMVDFFLLLKLAGAGDELQGIKRGIMEMADAIVINKADGDNLKNAKTAKVEFNRALHLYPPKDSGWQPKVLLASALKNEGIPEVWQLIEDYLKLVKENQFFNYTRNEQNKFWLLQTIEDRLKTDFYNNPSIKKELKHQLECIENGETTPFAAAELLLGLK